MRKRWFFVIYMWNGTILTPYLFVAIDQIHSHSQVFTFYICEMRNLFAFGHTPLNPASYSVTLRCEECECQMEQVKMEAKEISIFISISLIRSILGRVSLVKHAVNNMRSWLVAFSNQWKMDKRPSKQSIETYAEVDRIGLNSNACL